jgi:hypothetical protein
MNSNLPRDPFGIIDGYASNSGSRGFVDEPDVVNADGSPIDQEQENKLVGSIREIHISPAWLVVNSRVSDSDAQGRPDDLPTQIRQDRVAGCLWRKR